MQTDVEKDIKPLEIYKGILAEEKKGENSMYVSNDWDCVASLCLGEHSEVKDIIRLSNWLQEQYCRGKTPDVVEKRLRRLFVEKFDYVDGNDPAELYANAVRKDASAFAPVLKDGGSGYGYIIALRYKRGK